MSLTTTDPISDMLTRIRNVILVHKSTTNVPYSKIKEDILKIFKDNRLIDNYQVIDNGVTNKQILIEINANSQQTRINELKRVSKPGRRIYVNSKDIPTVKQGRGFLIISTSKGIMTSFEAKKKNIGGEILCQIY